MTRKLFSPIKFVTFVVLASGTAVACATATEDAPVKEVAPAQPARFEAGVDAQSPKDGGGPLFNDGAPDLDGASCVPDAGGPGPVGRVCLPATENECDGQHDVPTYPSNGEGGNGFDDDCDGLVDEGCRCSAAGTTKECYLVPASQTFGGVPVGWCAQNSKGTVDCVKPTSEFPGTWSGQCRGAQPAFADDFCADGDFNCDGKEQNSKKKDCSCKGSPVQCPSDPLVTAPFPKTTALPLKVDAAKWFVSAGNVARATNWKWTLRGGDCDNILPHPTFAMFGTSTTSGGSVGTQSDLLGSSAKEHGVIATSPQVSSTIYPAFSLSGDYQLQGEFDLNGEHFSCQQKIHVRAPGIRAEACWDTEGQAVDLDLHMAKLSTVGGCAQSGWSRTCEAQDCYYGNCKGTANSPNWYPANTDASVCHGWGSKTLTDCLNPRLDRDVISCSRTETDPNASSFCGPENINVDAPGNGDRFAIALKYFGGTLPSRGHVNVYCNGERVLSTGYNPVTSNDFPKLISSGANDSGDMWKVAMITTSVSPTGLDCNVEPIPSGRPHPNTDGSNAYCVDDTATEPDSSKFFTPGGAMPLDAPALCFH